MLSSQVNLSLPAPIGKRDPERLRLIRDGYQSLRPGLNAMRAALRSQARLGGLNAVLGAYDHTWNGIWVPHRSAALRRTALRSASLRAARLTRQLRRYDIDIEMLMRQRLHPSLDQVLRRYAGRLGSDDQIKRQFVRTATDALGKLRALKRQAEPEPPAIIEAAANPVKPTFGKPKVTPSKWKARVLRLLQALPWLLEGAPTIDPVLKKFAYPLDEDVTPEDLVEHAADFAVIGRGAYWAEVAMRDIARVADQAVIEALSGRTPVIKGWRWELSPAHDQASSSPDMCDVLARADFGYGPGVYLAGRLPQSHPACWCSTQPVWATEEELADPEWKPPEATDEYIDGVDELVAELTGREYLAPL